MGNNINYSKKKTEDMSGKLFGGKFKPTRVVLNTDRGTLDPVQQVDCFMQNFATFKSALSDQDDMQKEAFKAELAALNLSNDIDIADIFLNGDEDQVKEALNSTLEYEDQKIVMDFLE